MDSGFLPLFMRQGLHETLRLRKRVFTKLEKLPFSAVQGFRRIFNTRLFSRVSAAAVPLAEGRRLPVRLLLGALLQDTECGAGGRRPLPVHRQELCGQHHQRDHSPLRSM
jgi:hypothetical protein